MARPVRAIVAVESRREHVEAARATGAGPVRIVVRHLAPAAASAIATQVTLLLPAFVLAEATLSFVGLGFVDPTPSWGSMLMDAGRNVRALADFLAPRAPLALSSSCTGSPRGCGGGGPDTVDPRTRALSCNRLIQQELGHKVISVQQSK